GASTTSGPGKAGLTGVDTEVAAVLSVLHARSSWAGSPVEKSAMRSFGRAGKTRLSAAPGRLAHNGLVGGSNPSSPTTQFTVCGEILSVFAKAPNWRGSCTTAWSLRPLICGSGDVLTLFSPPWKSRFPATETVASGDSVRMESYCAGSPSILCWR